MAETNKALDRYLSPLDVGAMAFGCMIGWGVFAMPGNAFLPLAGPAGTLMAMLVSMTIMLIIANNFSYLMRRSSVTGGVYTYTKDAFGRDHAFLCSWFLCLSYLTVVFLNGTALFYVVRTVFVDALQSGIGYTIAGRTIYLGETLLSVLTLAGVGLLFVKAKPLLQKLQTILAVILFTGIVITAAACIPHAVSLGNVASFGTASVSGTYAVFSIVILAPWAFVGFEVTSFETAHFKFPMPKCGMIITLSIIAATFAYASMAIVSVSAVPEGFSSWQDYIGGMKGLVGVASVPTFHAAKSIMGNFGLAVMTATALAAILTGIIGGYRATTRVLSTMAEDHILSEIFSSTSGSILFIMFISIIVSFFGQNTLIWFVDLTSFGAIVAYGYTSAAAWKFAKAEGNAWVTICGQTGTAIAVVFVLVQLVPRLTALEAMGSEAFFLLSLWCLLGFIFYWRTVLNSTLTEFSGVSTSGLVFFALLLYSSLMWFARLLMRKESIGEMKADLVWNVILLMGIVFTGFIIMMYVQNLVRKKHEAAEREKIRAVESSLAKSRFLFNMSHDIRTPMNAIIGYTRLAMKESSSPDVRGFLQKIDVAGRQLLSLINDVLEMSRIESGIVELEFVPTDLCAVFDGMQTLFSEQMKQKGLSFSVHTSQVRNRYVWCDRKKLDRVLLNLLSNAYKFTPAGGKVSATLWENGSGENGMGSYEIRIQDSGIGISKEFVEKMFNAFERERSSTDSGVEGTGLGLSITRSIVDLMGGTIEVLTAPGNGTQFIVRLKFRPASAEDIPRGMQAEAQEDPCDFSGKRLLLVEDNEINLEIAEMILKQAGFAVETAENGQSALNKVAASAPGYYDAILMDIQMPVMNGYDAARAIRSLNDSALAGIPIIALTANAFSEDVQAAADAGMQAHIAKPIDVDVLRHTLSEILKSAG